MLDSMEQLLDGRKTYARLIVGGQAVLKERQSGMKVSITQLPPNCLLVNVPPGGKAHSGMLAAKRGFNVSCDYMLFAPRENNNVDAYFIELKSSLYLNPDDVPEQACRQILNTVPVMEYLRAMAKLHFEKTAKVNVRRVVIAEKSSPKLNKQRMKPEAIARITFNSQRCTVVQSLAQIPLGSL